MCLYFGHTRRSGRIIFVTCFVLCCFAFVYTLFIARASPERFGDDAGTRYIGKRHRQTNGSFIWRINTSTISLSFNEPLVEYFLRLVARFNSKFTTSVAIIGRNWPYRLYFDLPSQCDVTSMFRFEYPGYTSSSLLCVRSCAVLVSCYRFYNTTLQLQLQRSQSGYFINSYA